MDEYMYAWLAKIRWADLRRTADDVALSRWLGQRPAIDEAPRPTGSQWVTGRQPAPRRALGALAAAICVWSMGASLAWGHGGHAHGTAAVGRAAAPATGDSLGPRSARFDFDPPRPGSYRLPVVKPAADGAVVDATGTPRRLRDVLAGRTTVLSFVYTRCSDPNGCPLATAVLYQLHAATAGDPELARSLRLVTLSFD